MADKDQSEDNATPAFEPKAVHVGGESLADRLMPHIKKILVMFVLVAIAVSVFVIVRWRKHVGQEKRTAQLAEVLDVARRPVGEAPMTFPGQPAPPPGPRFKDAAERANAVLDAMAKAGADGGPAYKGGMLLDAGKIDEAIAAYREGAPADGLEGVLAREGLGLALEAKASQEKDPAARQKLLEESLAAFGTMQPDEAGPRRAYMLYHQGRLQLTLGKKDEAKASFEKAKALGDSTELPDLIERRLASM